MKKLSYILMTVLLFSCFGGSEEPNISREELLKMARLGDPSLSVVVPASITESVVNCRDYTPKCRFGYKVIAKKLSMFALFYEEQDDAKKAAIRVKAYRYRNWVFDDVRGEPVLERFVVKYLSAQKEF